MRDGDDDDPTRTPGDAPTLSPEEVPGALPAGHPTHIGRYRLLRMLGQGGMGTVYEAVQDHPRRRVALKVVRGGLASPHLARRFELEAELLGRLQHPGIAQIYEAGTDEVGGERQPFFAMELIRGETLLDHAARRGHSVRERLALMARVCEAVQHAHERGIVHRDLKPSNIVVDETGQPKILDFGVARATDADVRMTTVESAVGQLIGTLAYMSPEQVEADPARIDGRSDVYALGVVTYELLSGRHPYALQNCMLVEALRVIREDTPTPISAVNRVFRGDVETIVGKAMEKDRDRRYASAADLGADIDRYLREEPILARPAGTLYQLGKFARRNKVLVGSLAAVMVALAVGAGVSAWQASLARREAARARAVQDFLVTMLRSADPEQARGGATTVRELIDSAAERVKVSRLAGQPAVEGAVESTLAEAYGALGAYDEASQHGRRALALLRAPSGGPAAGVDADDLIRALAATGDAEYRLLQNDAAERSLREALDLALRAHGPDAVVTAQMQGKLAAFYNAMMRTDEAGPLLDAGAATLRRAGERESLAATLLEQGAMATKQGDLPRAEPLLREGLQVSREAWGPRHARVATASWLLADALVHKGAFDEAEPLLQEALAFRREVYGPEHPHVALVLTTLAYSRQDQGRFGEAEDAIREGLAIRRKSLGERHSAVAASLGDLGWLQFQKGDAAGAVETLRQAAEMFRATLGEKNADLPTVLNNLALALQGTGDLQGALPVWEETLAANRAQFGEDSHQVATTLINMAGIYFPMQRAEDAERVTREGLAIARRVRPPQAVLIGYGVNQLAFILQQRGAWDEALPLMIEAYELEKAGRPAGSVENAANLTQIGEAYVRLGRHEEARQTLEEAVALREAGLPAGDWRTWNSRSLLGAALLGLGQRAEAGTQIVAAAAALDASAEAPPYVKSAAQERVAALREK